MNDIQMVPLPPSPVTPIDAASEAEAEDVAPSEPERQVIFGSTAGRRREEVYVPESTEREPTTTLTLRLPVSMKLTLKELVDEHKTDMSKFIVRLLTETIPLVPRRKKRA
jgi:hypothetical protein